MTDLIPEDQLPDEPCKLCGFYECDSYCLGEDAGVDINAHWTPDYLTVRAVSLAGDAWLSDRIEGEATWIGDTLLVEHRFGPDLLLGAHQEGLTVALDGRIADAPREA